MKSIFAARQQYWKGALTKVQFNQLVAKEVFTKWVGLAKATEPQWYWLCELSAYLELKHLGYE